MAEPIPHRCAGMRKVPPPGHPDFEPIYMSPGVLGNLPIIFPPRWVPEEEEDEPEAPDEETLKRRRKALEKGVANASHGLSLVEPPKEIREEVEPAQRLKHVLESVISEARGKVSVLDNLRINAICEHTARMAYVARTIRDNYDVLTVEQKISFAGEVGKAVTQREQIISKLFAGLDMNEAQGDQLSAAIKTVDDGAKVDGAAWDDLEEIG